MGLAGLVLSIIEAALHVMERYFELSLIFEYLYHEDYIWAGLTIAFLCLPGLVLVGTMLLNIKKLNHFPLIRAVMFPVLTVIW